VLLALNMSHCTVHQKREEWTKIAKLREVFHDRSPEPVELAAIGPKSTPTRMSMKNLGRLLKCKPMLILLTGFP